MPGVSTQMVGLEEVPAVVGRMFEGKVRGAQWSASTPNGVATVLLRDTMDDAWVA